MDYVITYDLKKTEAQADTHLSDVVNLSETATEAKKTGPPSSPSKVTVEDYFEKPENACGRGSDRVNKDEKYDSDTESNVPTASSAQPRPETTNRDDLTVPDVDQMMKKAHDEAKDRYHAMITACKDLILKGIKKAKRGAIFGYPEMPLSCFEDLHRKLVAGGYHVGLFLFPSTNYPCLIIDWQTKSCIDEIKEKFKDKNLNKSVGLFGVGHILFDDCSFVVDCYV